MTKKVLIIGSLLLLSFSANAAVSGYYDSVKKINLALNSNELAEMVNPLSIKTVLIKGDRVLVTPKAGDCTFSVTLKYKEVPPGFMGAAQYEVSSVKALCTD